MGRDAGGRSGPEEIETSWPFEDEGGRYKLVTKPEVLHAESNAIAKLARCSESGKDSVMFLTHSPCIDCAKQIYTAGINTLFYAEDYRSNAGIEFLKKCNIEVIKWNTGENTTSPT